MTEPDWSALFVVSHKLEVDQTVISGTTSLHQLAVAERTLEALFVHGKQKVERWN